MDGTEINTRDFGRGEFIRGFDGPESGTSADVEDSLRVRVNGRAEETAAENELEDVVFEVETLLLLFVVGEEVFAGAVSVIAAAVFICVIEDGGGYGGRGTDGSFVVIAGVGFTLGVLVGWLGGVGIGHRCEWHVNGLETS